jgi:broad specificity phosphatase PhoE
MKMRTWALVGLALATLASWPLWWWFCGRPTTLLIVRHADRDAGVDALNAAGAARAQELVHVGEKSGVAAIYRSDTNRARDTAAPLATALGLTPVVYIATDTSALVEEIFAEHRGEKVLVVGHSNTVPDIIEAAGGPSLPELDDKDFDNVFVLTVCRCVRGGRLLVNLQYGAVSPPLEEADSVR